MSPDLCNRLNERDCEAYDQNDALRISEAMCVANMNENMKLKSRAPVENEPGRYLLVSQAAC